MNYHMIRTDDMLNGDGLRVVLFVSGCNNHCIGCHNPETWDEESGMKFDDEAMLRIMNELDNDYISGITLSGGDPLFYENLADVLEVVSCIKYRYSNKTIWLYTGMTWNQIFEPVTLTTQSERMQNIISIRKKIVSMCDVLVDGKFIEELADVNYPWAGSSNQKVIDVQETLKQNKIVLYDK